MKEKLIDLGYIETKPNLFVKELKGGIKLYHDYRKGEKVSYAFNNEGSINIKNIPEYMEFKLREEGEKCRKLGEFK